MNKRIVFCVVLQLVFLFSSHVQAQTAADSIAICPIKTFSQLFRKEGSVLAIKPVKSNFFLIIPIIASQPSTGFAYGFVSQYTFKGKKPKDKYSSVNLGATFTEKKQLLINAKNNVMLSSNKFFLNGDWRFYIFSQDNYGLGTDIIPPKRHDADFDLDALKGHPLILTNTASKLWCSTT